MEYLLPILSLNGVSYVPQIFIEELDKEEVKLRGVVLKRWH